MTSTPLFARPPAPRRHPPSRTGFALPIVMAVALVAAATAAIAYLLWPRWPGPPLAPDAPPLPITIGGVTFNVPPAALRVPVQRRPGAQERIDLAFLWPSLEPPPVVTSTTASAATASPAPRTLERIFVTIAAAGDKLAPAERVK